jgi:DNA-binding protein H-NS
LAKSLAQLNEQIAKLQREADALQAKEVAGVVARIRDAIEHYGLTPAQLFDAPRASSGKAKAPAREQTRRKRPGAPARKRGVIRFRDEAGNSWTGHGKRPNWFKAALEAGKTPDDLAVKGS